MTPKRRRQIAGAVLHCCCGAAGSGSPGPPITGSPPPPPNLLQPCDVDCDPPDVLQATFTHTCPFLTSPLSGTMTFQPINNAWVGQQFGGIFTGLGLPQNVLTFFRLTCTLDPERGIFLFSLQIDVFAQQGQLFNKLVMQFVGFPDVEVCSPFFAHYAGPTRPLPFEPCDGALLEAVVTA
jgi:hypothetical protein